jgi:O-acetyl-ADP-ribose deacetylase (regulator of RNase III)
VRPPPPVSPVVEAVQGDITTLEVDAVVNASNHALSDGAGVNGAIHRAAGRAQLSAACATLGGCATGDAKATPGFALPARLVIHTVGPVWHDGSRDEEALLALCYRRSLEVAAGLGARSVAFPAISTGIFGFPPERAAEIAVTTVRSVLTPDPNPTATPASTGVERVVLVAHDDETYRRYVGLIGRGG